MFYCQVTESDASSIAATEKIASTVSHNVYELNYGIPHPTHTHQFLPLPYHTSTNTIPSYHTTSFFLYTSPHTPPTPTTSPRTTPNYHCNHFTTHTTTTTGSSHKFPYRILHPHTPDQPPRVHFRVNVVNVNPYRPTPPSPICPLLWQARATGTWRMMGA